MTSQDWCCHHKGGRLVIQGFRVSDFRVYQRCGYEWPLPSLKVSGERCHAEPRASRVAGSPAPVHPNYSLLGLRVLFVFLLLIFFQSSIMDHCVLHHRDRFRRPLVLSSRAPPHHHLRQLWSSSSASRRFPSLFKELLTVRPSRWRIPEAAPNSVWRRWRT